MPEIDRIITHPKPHLDEIVALALLREFGETKYPGVRDVIDGKRIRFCRGDDAAIFSEEYEKAHTLCLGVGHGKFDEHGSIGAKRKDGECCATLVAGDLGNVPPEWEYLLSYVRNVDLNPSASPFDLATLVKDMNEEQPDAFRVIDWAFAAIKAKVAKQRGFLEAPKAVREGKIEFVDTGHGKPIKMLSVRTDCTSVGQYNRSENGPKAAILIQQNSRGQVQIFTLATARVCLDAVARILIEREGPIWYYGKTVGNILNGSLTAQDTPATNIPFCEVLDIVRKNISRFPKRT